MPSRRLVSQENASIIKGANVPRSRFTGSWTRKTAFDAGYLVPILVDEVLPGDHLTYDVTAYVRMATPLFPMLDNQRIDTFFFFVPNRLLWKRWPEFMGEQANPGNSIEYTIPDIQPAAGYAVGSLFDHMGLPMTGFANMGVNALPFRAYNKIFNAWFRDQNVQDKVVEDDSDATNNGSYYTLLRRNKAHDYFTSALPWPQKFTAPTVPLGGLAPVLGIGSITGYGTINLDQGMKETGGINTVYSYYRQAWAPNNIGVKMSGNDINASYPQVYADLSQATGVAINTLRQAWLVQSLLEQDARGGTRYVELIKAHFGVTSPDFRLARPEYIGGGQSPLQLTPIAQTAPTAGASVGNLGAAATAVGQHRASYAATEHGYIIGLINVRSDLSYQQGMHRMWTRKTRFDFYWPALAGLGEQAIYRKEIYYTGIPADDNTVFGYQERHHEYRTRYSEVTGVMRSTANGTLDAWHLAQKFNSAPVLGTSFLQEDPPMSRVLAAGATAAGQQYLADILFRRTAVRPIPMYGTPASIGRF